MTDLQTNIIEKVQNYMPVAKFVFQKPKEDDKSPSTDYDVIANERPA